MHVFMYNLYSKSKSELFGFERGVDGARDRPQQQLTQNLDGGKFAGGSLNEFRLSLPSDQHRMVMFYF